MMDPNDPQALSEIQSYLANFNKDLTQQVHGFTILAPADGSLAGSDQLYAATSDDKGGKMEGHLEPLATLTSLAPAVAATQPGAVFAIPAGAKMTDPLSATPIDQHLMQQPHQQQSLQALPTVSTGLVMVSDPQQPSSMEGMMTTAQLTTTASSTSQLFTMQAQPPAALPSTDAKDGGAQEEQEDSKVVMPSNQFQTVTIVPSEVNQGGEVSYVLIVSQGEGDKAAAHEDEDLDLSVYDFKEDKGGELSASDLTGDRKGVKFLPKKGTSTPLQSSQQLMCNYCNYTSPKRYLLTRHMKTHSEERPHKCYICNRGFKTMPSMQNHINTHTGVRPHKCKECDASFTTSGELVRHVRYKHTFEKPHHCPKCDYASVELSKLRRHVRSHTGERPFQCPHCAYASPDTYKLKRHLRIHTGEKPYECDICHSRFTQSNSLKAHKLIHTGNKPVFQCELCPTTCGRRTDLKIHVQKLHTSDKPIQCKKCGKSFPDRYTYKIHVKTHEGEKCFKCELCPYSALSQRHLESHILTHTGEKPFECDKCDQTFRQKQLLKRHKNLYHTPDYVAPPPRDKVHECPECNKIFAHHGNLLRHLVTHDPDNLDLNSIEEQIMREEGAVEEEGEGGEREVIGEMIATQGQLVGTGPDGIQLAEVNGQQVQVQLVSVGGEDGQQVYVQIGGADLTGTTQAGTVVMATDEEIAQLQQEGAHLALTADGAGGFQLIKQVRFSPHGSWKSVPCTDRWSCLQEQMEPSTPLEVREGRPSVKRQLQPEMEAAASIEQALQDQEQKT